MYIYRIEHIELTENNEGVVPVNKGPYSSFNFEDEKDQAKHKKMFVNHRDFAHPSLIEDLQGIVGYSDLSNYYCACPSLDVIKEWFKGYVSVLLRNGFAIVQIKVSNKVVGWSGDQVFFKASDIISKRIVKH